MRYPRTKWPGRGAACSTGAAAVIGMLGGSTPVWAQTPTVAPKVFYACYVPLAGVVYRIREPGLLQGCSTTEHVQFSWTDGVASNDHGQLTGLADDDHPQYVTTDGSRALTGPLSAGGNRLTNLAAASANDDAVRFEEAMKGGDVAAGDLTGTNPDPRVAKVQGVAVAATMPNHGEVLSYNGTEWAPAVPGSLGGTFQSPNGLFTLSLTDSGLELKGPGGRVLVSAAGVSVVGAASVSLVGATVTLNGCAPIARVGDTFTGVAHLTPLPPPPSGPGGFGPGPFGGSIATGSTSVFAC